MKTSNLVEALQKGNIVIPTYLLKNYKSLGLDNEEFILLIGLIGEGSKFPYDVPYLSEKMNMDKGIILDLIDKLSSKKIINIVVEKNKDGMLGDCVDLSPFYEKLSMIMVGENKKEDCIKNSNLYEQFEKEFGRTLSPIEFEIIGGWLSDNFTEELILAALKEATYNNVSNLRYIDKILYEWQKKGIDTISKIEANKVEHSKKQNNVELFDYNWLEDDE